MDSKKTALKVAGIVFLLISAVQLLRVILKPEVLVAGHSIPIWPNLVAFVIFFSLSIWMFKANR